MPKRQFKQIMLQPEDFESTEEWLRHSGGGEGQIRVETQLSHAPAPSTNRIPWGRKVPGAGGGQISHETQEASAPAKSIPVKKPGRPAKEGLKPNHRVPAAASAPEMGLRGGGGQGGNETQGVSAPSSPPTIISALIMLQRRRRFCIKSQSRCDRSMEALIASTMGFAIDADEKARKKVFDRAKAYRLSVERGDAGDQGANETQSWAALLTLIVLIDQSATAREGWDVLRKRTEAEMEALAKQLPVWEFVRDIRGLGALGLAVIMAEAAHPLDAFANPGKLWKRLGLAVINGGRQRRVKGAEEALAHGYSPHRRAEIWAFCSDTLFRGQWVGDRDEDGVACTKSHKPVVVPAHPLGPYGEAYQHRREHTAARVAQTGNLPDSDPDKWSLGRCNNDARRYMTKRLLKDLWVAWRGARKALKPNKAMPPATSSEPPA